MPIFDILMDSIHDNLLTVDEYYLWPYLTWEGGECPLLLPANQVNGVPTAAALAMLDLYETIGQLGVEFEYGAAWAWDRQTLELTGEFGGIGCSPKIAATRRLFKAAKDLPMRVELRLIDPPGVHLVFSQADKSWHWRGGPGALPDSLRPASEWELSVSDHIRRGGRLSETPRLTPAGAVDLFLRDATWASILLATYLPPPHPRL